MSGVSRLVPEIPRIDVDAYRKQGFVLVPRLVDGDAIARMREEANAMLARVAGAGRNIEATWGGDWREQLIGKARAGDGTAAPPAAVSSIHDVQYHSAYFMR